MRNWLTRNLMMLSMLTSWNWDSTKNYEG